LNFGVKEMVKQEVESFPLKKSETKHDIIKIRYKLHSHLLVKKIINFIYI
jgi:hypothetical protein